jgi:hypothetical protein
VRRSKTDQEDGGRLLGVHRGQHPGTCPVHAVDTWLRAAAIDDGPVFRPVSMLTGHLSRGRLCDRNVARVVQRCARRAGLEPARYDGHSLRAGLATAAAAAGAEERAIMAQTGPRSVTVLRRSIRSGSLFRGNVSGMPGL